MSVGDDNVYANIEPINVYNINTNIKLLIFIFECFVKHANIRGDVTKIANVPKSTPLIGLLYIDNIVNYKELTLGVE